MSLLRTATMEKLALKMARGLVSLVLTREVSRLSSRYPRYRQLHEAIEAVLLLSVLLSNQFSAFCPTRVTGGSHSLQQWSKQPPPPPVVLKRHAALEAVREGGNWQPALSAIGTAAWYNPSPAIFCSHLQLGPIHGCEKDQCERHGCLLSYFIIFFAQNSANVEHLILIQARECIAAPK